jgi:hypothetical protein
MAPAGRPRCMPASASFIIASAAAQPISRRMSSLWAKWK